MTGMLVVACVMLVTSETLNRGQLCHASCFGNGLKHNGHCPSGFCGDGACCQEGLALPPCDGVMGCTGFQCCADETTGTVDVADAHVGVGQAQTAPSAGIIGQGLNSVPPPPPLPPLSECAISRVEYEIGKQRHDALGDKEYEVLVRIEPWRPESLIKLEYHETNVEDGAERPIEGTFTHKLCLRTSSPRLATRALRSPVPLSLLPLTSSGFGPHGGNKSLGLWAPRCSLMSACPCHSRGRRRFTQSSSS